MLWWIYIPEKLLALFCACVFLCSGTTAWFILSSGPLLGAQVFLAHVVYMFSVLFYLRVVVLCCVL